MKSFRKYIYKGLHAVKFTELYGHIRISDKEARHKLQAHFMIKDRIDHFPNVWRNFVISPVVEPDSRC